MQCRRCGKEIGDSPRCNFCGFENEEGNVREMTRLERNFYDGVTIDAGDSTEENSGRYKTNFGGQNFRSGTTFIRMTGGGIFSRLFAKFLDGLMNNGIIVKIIAVAIFVIFAASAFFVFLPIFFIIAALGIALAVAAKFKK